LFAAVIKMEGGTDHDLRTLDAVSSSSNTTIENDDGDEDTPKQSSLDKTESSTSITDNKASSENKVIYKNLFSKKLISYSYV
jgi:hypothetical protein